MEELYSRSQIIVIGKVVESKEVINMARDVYDPTKPDSHLFIIGQVYLFQIEKYLKGSGSKLISVAQEEGFIRNNANPTIDEIAKAKLQADFLPFILEKEYLLYLRPLLGGPDDTYFSGTSHPWRFSLEDRDKVTPESTWKDAEKYFPVKSLTEIISDFESPTLSPTSPYPLPATPYP